MTRPLALTLGEPAGIGPDITLAAWCRRDELKLPAFYLLADPDHLARRARVLGLDVPIRVVAPEDAGAAFADALPVVALDERVSAEPGSPDASSAPAAIASIHSGRSNGPLIALCYSRKSGCPPIPAIQRTLNP